MDATTVTTAHPVGRRARRPATRRSPPTCRPTSRTSSRARQHRLRQLHPRRRRRGRALGRRRSSSELGADGRAPAGPGRPPRRHGRRARSTGLAGGPRVLLIGHMDTVFDPGTAAERPFRIEDGVAYGPGVTDMKSGLLAGLYALKAIVARASAACRSSGSTFIANPDEEIGSPTSTPHIRRSAADVRRRARPRVRPRERRHRLGAQGHPRHCGSSSTAGRRTPASSPRRVAARSSRRRGSCASCTRSTVAGRASPSTSGASPAGRDRTSSPRRARSRSTSGRPPATRSRRPRRPIREHRRGDRGPRRDRRLRGRWRAGGRWRSSSAAAGWSSTPRASRERLGFEVARHLDRRRVRRQHDVRAGRPEPRRPRADRRQRPRAGGVPRRRLDRAADDDAGRPAAGHRRATRRSWPGATHDPRPA